MCGTAGGKLGAVALATLVIGLAACGAANGAAAPELVAGKARTQATKPVRTSQRSLPRMQGLFGMNEAITLPLLASNLRHASGCQGAA